MNLITVAMFVAILLMSLGITAWAARRTRTTVDFYAAGCSGSTIILSIDWFDGQVAEQFDIEMRKHEKDDLSFPKINWRQFVLSQCDVRSSSASGR